MGFRDVLLFLAAIAPGLLICWYIYKMDKYEREQPFPLFATFWLGAFATLGVVRIETWATYSPFLQGEGVLFTLFSSFIVVALTEELVKYLCLFLYPYRSRFFNEPMDGIVYAVMIGMGFATLENLMYALQYGLETVILRAFTAVPAHAAFAIIMGYYFGKAKFEPDPKIRRKRLLMALFAPLVIHGLYDFLILQEIYEGLIALAIAVLIASIIFARQLLLEQQENSPFKES
ncbi:PrsW family intramembrane metalloprotease [Phaeodactylibacter xiamenensis]|uniref:PrsW family intramembrane metalloprotease n=1 Tax=Phaeodactylibacter xiamenensis TaxID=1524460 RepID=UPI0006979066|nr:PrsW family glutamic-type intramembrane protease [Phaeodactylibacter xiamenensis]MCR9055261.1 PrsW family glutamic-type intramembrane protease [bacterium]